LIFADLLIYPNLAGHEFWKEWIADVGEGAGLHNENI